MLLWVLFEEKFIVRQRLKAWWSLKARGSKVSPSILCNQNIQYFTGEHDDSTRNSNVNILGISLGLFKLQIPTSRREQRGRGGVCQLTQKPEHSLHWLFPPGRLWPHFPCLGPYRSFFPAGRKSLYLTWMRAAAFEPYNSLKWSTSHMLWTGLQWSDFSFHRERKIWRVVSPRLNKNLLTLAFQLQRFVSFQHPDKSSF